MKTKMDGLEAEKANLEAQLRDIPAEDPITLHPGLADIYARKVANLAEALNAEDTRSAAADILRGLIDKLIFTPDSDAPNGHKIELYGELGAILSLCNNGMSANAKTRTVGAGIRQLTMVSGAGFAEAPTIDIAA
jgi:site-specific DNA recombinase